jgi:hypothetical protein
MGTLVSKINHSSSTISSNNSNNKKFKKKNVILKNNNPLRFPFTSFTSFTSSSSSLTNQSISLESDWLKSSLMKDIHQDTKLIRMKILLDIKLEFLYPTILIIYGPPLSHCDDLAIYLSHKLQFPIFSSFDVINRTDFFQLRIQSSDCLKGFILINFPHTIYEGDLLNHLIKGYKQIVLHIETDFTVKFSLSHSFSFFLFSSFFFDRN